MKWTTILVTILFLSPSLFVKAQSNSTNANPLAGNEFTATTNVSIPLVTKKVDNIDLGITLNYNTGGIRLDQVASIVGLGWNLNYGPSISRVVKGIPDEYYPTPYLGNPLPNFMGYWHRTNAQVWVGPPDASLCEEEIAINVSNGSIDGQMDMFYLNLGGAQVQFFINAENEIKTIPDNSRIKIQRTVSNSPITTFAKGVVCEEIGFIVTDGSGNTYHFRSGEKTKANIRRFCPVEFYDGNQSSMPVRYYAVEWVIEQIQTYNGKTIQYNYSPYVEYTYFAGINQEVYDLDMTTIGSSVQIVPSQEAHKIIQKNSSIDLESIDFPDLTIKFNYNSTPRCDHSAKGLKEIEIIEKTNSSSWGLGISPPIGYLNSKNIIFDQSYFSVVGQRTLASCVSYGPTDGYNADLSITPSSNYRLRLDAIKSGANSGSRTLYNFEYYDISDISNINTFEAIQLPYRSSPSADYWGFYNGNLPVSPNISFSTDNAYVPEITPSGLATPIGVNREPNINNKIFSLKKVINENKGCSEFVYGLNQAIVNGQLTNLDGLRLDKVRDYTIGMNNTTIHETSYVYEDGEWILPSMYTPLTVKDFFHKQIHVIYKLGPWGVYWSHPNEISNLDVYTNQFTATLDQVQHGYRKVITTSNKIVKSKDISSTLITSTTKLIGTTETYYLGLKNLNSHFTFSGSSLSGSAYSLNSTNTILPSPQISSSLNGSLLIASNFNKGIFEMPFTNKQYYINWILGTPYKTVTYDAYGTKTAESEYEYDVHVKALNTDNFLNLNGTTKFWKYIMSGDGLSVEAGLDNCNRGGIYYSDAGLYNFNQYDGTSWHFKGMIYDYYYPFIGRIDLKKSKNTVFHNGVSHISKTTNFSYDATTGYSRNSTEIDNVTNTIIENIQFYSSDNNNWTNNALMENLAIHNIDKVIYSEVWKTKPLGTPQLMNASGGGYALFNNKVRDKYSYGLIKNSPLSISPITSGSYTIQNANLGNLIPQFEKRGVTTRYDYFGNVCEVEIKGKYTSSLYDYYQDALLATATNAKYTEIAFNSFESNIYEQDNDAIGLYNEDKGNWQFPLNAINFSNGITGKRSYDLSKVYQGQPVKIISSPLVELEIGKKYIVSFWKKNGNVTLENWSIITGTTPPPIVNNLVIPFTEYTTNNSSLPSLNNWTFCQVEFTALYSRMRVTGTALIDELRLYPADASLTTTTFTPLYGKISDCDASNTIIHYEHNDVSREKLTRDIQGNIISKTKTASQLTDY